MKIIAHRANAFGSNKITENSTDATLFCLQHSWGVETDIRRTSDGCYYISHDVAECTINNQANRFCALYRQYPNSVIAMNIKELGYEVDLLQYLSQQEVLSQVFLFDMEMLEDQPGKTAALFHQSNDKVQLAARVSDRGESIDQALRIHLAKVIWIDEFDRLWITEREVIRLKTAGKIIYAISPEIHGFSLAEMRSRWKQFYDWGIDGICTDYPAELSLEIQTQFRREL